MDVRKPGSDFRTGTVEVGEFVLDYAEAGPDDPSATLVFFPGSAGLEMSTAKDELAKKYRIVEINPPGWGGTDTLTRPMPQSEIGALLAEAANQLVDGDYYVVGSSMGGTNAVHAAAVNGERIKGFISDGGMTPAREEDVIVPPPPRPDPDAAEAPEGTAPEYPLPPFDPRKPWADEAFVRGQMEKRFKMFRWVYPEFIPEDALTKVRDSGIPMLALLGDEDAILRPSQREAFATYLPKADFRLIPGGTHDLQNTNADQFVTLVEEFLNR